MQKLVRKIDFRLVLFLAFIYCFCSDEDRRFLVFENSVESGTLSKCPKVNKHPTNRWFNGVNLPNGIASQLFGIYSFVPVARLFEVNLIVNGIYTRLSFDEKHHAQPGSMALIPFSEYFDWEFFKDYWRQKRLTLLEATDYSKCPQELPVLQVRRDPSFGPLKDEELIAMMKRSGVEVPIPPGSVLSFVGTGQQDFKFAGLFNFRRNGFSAKQLLFKVHESLQPAPYIRSTVDAIVRALPESFVVVHLRLEGDMMMLDATQFRIEVEKAMARVLKAQCFSTLPTEGRRLLNTPPIYLASGLFGEGSPLMQERAKMVLSDLRALGFDQIHTRSSVLQQLRDEGKFPPNTARRRLAAAPHYGQVVQDFIDLHHPHADREEEQPTLSQSEKKRLKKQKKFFHSPDKQSPGPFSPASQANHPTVGLGPEWKRTLPSGGSGGLVDPSLSNPAHLQKLAASRISGLLPEQEAFVDLQVSRNCSCFAPSHVSSAFSYMALRLRYLDANKIQGVLETGRAEYGPSYHFRLWGM